MVKVLVLLLNSVLIGKAFSDVTNLSQIVNVPLTQSVVAQIHARDFSSPETAYLSFLKSVFTCDASAFVAGFSPEIIMRMTGGANPDSVSPKQINTMRVVLGDMMPTNSVLQSYSISNRSDFVIVSSRLCIPCNGGVETNSFPIGYIHTNGTWRISKFLEDFEND